MGNTYHSAMEVIYGVEDGVTHVSEQPLPISLVYTPHQGGGHYFLPPLAGGSQREGV